MFTSVIRFKVNLVGTVVNLPALNEMSFIDSEVSCDCK